MNLPQTICLYGYVVTQNINYHVTVKTLENDKRVGHFQCDHELSGEELIKLAAFMNEIREGTDKENVHFAEKNTNKKIKVR